MEWWHIYLFTRLDSFSTFFTVVMVVTTIAVIAGGLALHPCHG